MAIIKSKHILSYIIDKSDADILSQVVPYKDKLFQEVEELELFEMLEGIFNTQHLIPKAGLLKNYALSKKAKEILKSLEIPEEFTDAKSVKLSVDSLLYQAFIDYVTIEVRTELQDLASSDITKFEDKTQDLISSISGAFSLSKLKNTRESLIYGDEYINKARTRYAKTKVEGNYIICKTGYKNLDEKIGGIANNDFINIYAYVKQFKSTLQRNLIYNSLLQGKNCLLITLEMSDEEVEAEMQTIHSANKVRFGPGRSFITSEQIKSGTLMDDAEDFLFNEVIPDLANSDDLGLLKVINPSEDEYFFADLIADIDRTRAMMDIDLIFLDYLTLIKPNKRSSREDVNDMIKAMRKYSLTHKIPVVNCVQVGRNAYNEMLEDEHHRYKPDSASDFNEFERSSTLILSTAQTPEMINANEIYVSCILSRRSKVDNLPFKTISSNSRLVEVTQSDNVEEDTEEVLKQINIG